LTIGLAVLILGVGATTASAASPTAVTKAATLITQGTATLNATVNPNGANVTECKFEYGPTETYGSTASCSSLPGSGNSPVAVSAPVTGLAANTPYHFRISATNGSGTNKGNDETLKTLPNPPAVVTKAATLITQGSATLNATVNPNGANVTECKFEYGPTETYGSTASCSSLPGSGNSPVAVSAPVTGLAANTPYHFRISATNGSGTNKGNDETLKTLPNPPAVVTKAATLITQGSATLNATVNPNGGEVGKCEFEYGPTEAYGSTASCSSLPATGEGPVAVSASITGLIANTPYHFRISATNGGGTSKGSDESLETLPNGPSVGTEAVSTLAQTSVSLNATVNPDGGKVTECVFEYGTTTGYGSTAQCSSSPGSGTSPVSVSAFVTGLTANVTYHFRIFARNAGGPIQGGDQTFKTLPNPPTAVTEATTALAQTTATLAATVNPDGGEVTDCKFEYGTTVAYGSSATCTSLPGSGSSPIAVLARITDLAANTTYHFRIVASNTGGTSEGADQTFTTPANVSTITVTIMPGPAPIVVHISPPNSTFKTLGAVFNPASHVITFTESVAEPGIFRWLLTFQNGKFGVFGATAARCKGGFVRLAGKCRPSKIVFAKGSSSVTASGTVTFALKPTASALRALKNAYKQKKSLPVAMTLTFQSVRSTSPVSRLLALTVRTR
jgi:phosphodiesterase/alkaline phosphatase D-like protein